MIEFFQHTAQLTVAHSFVALVAERLFARWCARRVKPDMMFINAFPPPPPVDTQV